MKNKKITIIVLNIILVLFTASLITKTLQNDTFFTIATGNNIFENGLDNKEYLTWHENLTFEKVRWLFDVLIATIYKFSNFEGIYIFTIIMSCIIAVLVFNILNKKSNNTILSFALTLLSIYCSATYGGFTARAQIMSYALLILEIFFVEKLIQTNKKYYLIILFFISVLIANFHASVWLISEILLLPYLVDIILGKFIKKETNISFHKDANLKLFVFAILVIAVRWFLQS